MLSSILVPLFGHTLTFVSAQNYTLFCIFGMVLIGGAHVIFLLLLEDLNKGGHLNQVWIIFIPIIMITFAHTIFSTLQVPITKLNCSSEDHIPKLLSLSKICEAVSISLTMMATGHLRKSTGSYISVSCLIIALSFVGGCTSIWLHHHPSQPET